MSTPEQDPPKKPPPTRPEPAKVGPEFLAWLGEKWKGSQICPVCQSQSWNVQEQIFQLTPFYKEGTVLGPGPLIPVVPITCNTCGYTLLINAIKSGQLVPPQPNAKDTEDVEDESETG